MPGLEQRRAPRWGDIDMGPGTTMDRVAPIRSAVEHGVALIEDPDVIGAILERVRITSGGRTDTATRAASAIETPQVLGAAILPKPRLVLF